MDIRIALVHSFYASRSPSGENRVVEAERDALARAGHEVHLVAAHTDDREQTPGHALRSAARVATGRGHSPLHRLTRLRPDVIHVHNLFPNFGRKWVRRADVPVVHTLHNYRPMCAAATLFRDGHVCTLCPDGDRWAGFRYACYRDSRAATLPLTLAGLGGAGADPLLRRADRLVVLSEQMRQRYVDDGVDGSRLVVWPNFLPSSLDLERPGGVTVGPDAPWLFVGRFTPEKGVRELVEHWPDGHPLQLVGDGPLRPELERLTRGRAIEVVGRLERWQVVDRMSRSVGLVFPSRWIEPFGLVYIEALAAGLPVLASGPHAVADLVAAEGTGRVIDLAELPSVVPGLRDEFIELRDHCRDVFEQRYTEAAHVDRAVDLYRQLAGSS